MFEKDSASLSFPKGSPTPSSVAGELIPFLREQTTPIDAAARLPDNVVDEFESRGLFRLSYPHVYGGQQIGFTEFMDTIVNLGRGNMSAAWVVSILNGCTAMVARAMPDHVSEEVFATPGGAKVAGAFTPRTLKARPKDGGVYIEEGLWGFNSGVRHANWDLLGVPLYDADGNEVDQGFALLPTSKIEILDDWNTLGMRGSGSNTVRATDIFVPNEWILPFGRVRRDNYTVARFKDIWQYRITSISEAPLGLAFPVIGAAIGALEVFLGNAKKRGIQYTDYDKQSEAPVTHLQVGEASAKIDAAKALARSGAMEIEQAAQAGLQMSRDDGSRIRRDAGFIGVLAWQAVDQLASGSGGSFIGARNAVNPYWKDIRAGTLHGAVTASTVLEAYGRVLCGLPSNITRAGVA